MAPQKAHELMVLEKRITPAVDWGNSGGEGLLHGAMAQVRIKPKRDNPRAAAAPWRVGSRAEVGEGLLHWDKQWKGGPLCGERRQQRLQLQIR